MKKLRNFSLLIHVANAVPKSNNSGLKPHTLPDVACPFCPLLCDDLTVEVDAAGLQVSKNGCALAVENFAREIPQTTPQINGKRASLSKAIEAASDILRRAQAPLISGLGTDVDGIREAVHVAEKSKGIVDHANSTAFDSTMRVLQTRGWYTTTLAELRNRADLVILIGPDIVNHYANFLRRYIEPKQTLNPKRRKARQVFYLGDKRVAPQTSRAITIDPIPCRTPDIPAVVGALRAVVAGRSLEAKKVAGVSIKQLQRLASAIAAAQYPVFVWAPGHFATQSADLAIQTTTDLIADLNQTQRAAGLALGGDNGGVTAANVCAWLTGFPLHVSFAGKKIDYDAIRYRTDRLIKDDQIDALLWIDAFGTAGPPSTKPGVKRIVLGLPAAKSVNADVFIPVGTPGVDHAGRIIRTDSVVSLHVDQLRKNSRATVREVLRAITAGL